MRTVLAMTAGEDVHAAGSARRGLGDRGEDLAAAYLQEQGYRVVARNWRRTTGPVRGEIDLLAACGRTLAVVEVKTRRGDAFGGPVSAVTRRKQAKLRALATAWLRASGGWRGPVRFDVVAVWLRPGRLPELRHIPGAF